MKKLNLIKWFFPLLLLYGCNSSGSTINTNNGDPVYQIDLKDCLRNTSVIKLSDIADNLQYIELKTPSSLPIGMVSNMIISNEYIFIASKATLYQFDLQGNFIRQVGNTGKGPGEYLYAGDLSINEDEKKISILSAGGLYSYSFDGTFIGRVPFGGFSDTMVEDSLIYASNIPFGKEKYRMVVLNKELETLAGIPNHNIFDAGGLSVMLSFRFRKPFYKYCDNIYFKGYQDNDTIWRLNGMRYKTHAVIDMGKYKYPEYRNVGEMRTMFTNFHQKKGDYYQINAAMEDNRFIYLTVEPYWNPDMGSPRLLFDKFQNIGVTAITESKDDGITDDILGGPAFWPRLITGNYSVSVTDAYDFIEKSQSLSTPSSQFKEFMQGIDEESNPIVTIVTLKTNKTFKN